MALVCFHYKLAPPDYWRLTIGEHRALVNELKRQAKQGGDDAAAR